MPLLEAAGVIALLLAVGAVIAVARLHTRINRLEAALSQAESATSEARSVRTIAETSARSALECAEAARLSAAAAACAGDASRESAGVSRTLAELGNRAWVHATEIRAVLKTKDNENSTLEVRIANLGSTPARQLRLLSSFHIADEVPDDLPLKPRVSNIVLGPGVSFSLSHFLRVSPADAAAIATGKRLLLASGQAEYVDVYGIQRETRWCAVYNFSDSTFSAAAKHNSVT